jgi:hypothetical protein
MGGWFTLASQAEKAPTLGNFTFLSEASYYSDQIKPKKCYIWTQRPGFSLIIGYL